MCLISHHQCLHGQVQLLEHLTRPRWRETLRTWINLLPIKSRSFPCLKRIWSSTTFISTLERESSWLHWLRPRLHSTRKSWLSSGSLVTLFTQPSKWQSTHESHSDKGHLTKLGWTGIWWQSRNRYLHAKTISKVIILSPYIDFYVDISLYFFYFRRCYSTGNLRLVRLRNSNHSLFSPTGFADDSSEARTVQRHANATSPTTSPRHNWSSRWPSGWRTAFNFELRQSAISKTLLWFGSIIAHSQEKLFREPDSYIYINAQFNSVISTVTAAAITSLCNNQFFLPCIFKDDIFTYLNVMYRSRLGN